MYNRYFGFLESPFSVTPDPRFFYSNSVYLEAYANLRYGIEAKKGFIAITGEVGTGKTTLLRKLMHSLQSSIHSVFIFNTAVSFNGLLRLILSDLGLPAEGKDRLAMIEDAVFRWSDQAMYLGFRGFHSTGEDLNDHDSLRHDVVMGLLSEKRDPSGKDRVREQDQGKAIAGKSTLNRLELTPEDANEKSRYKKIVADGGKIDELMVALFIESYQSAPSEVVLDVDATDDPLHGNQEGRYFHGYYAEYCYLPFVYLQWRALAVCAIAPGQ